MEASAAGLASGQAGDGAGQSGQGEGAEATPQGGADFSGLEAMLAQQSQQGEETRAAVVALQEALNARQQEATTQDPYTEAGLEEPYADPYAEQWDPRALAQSVAQFTQQELMRSTIEPMRQQLTQMQEQQQVQRWEQDLRDISSQFPELKDPEVAKNVLGKTQEWAQLVGQPDLALNPHVMRLVYMAGTASEQANQEGGGIPAVAQLESGSGAGPAGGQQTENLVKAMFAQPDRNRLFE